MKIPMRLSDDEQEARECAPRAVDQGPSEVPVRDLAREREDRFRAIAERALEEQLEVERRISELSRRFLHVAPEDFSACMNEALETIAGLADADRSRFVVVGPSNMDLAGEYQWGAEAMRRRPEITDWKGEVAHFLWSAKKLVAGEVLHVPRLADLPPEAAAERASFEADGVTSYLGLPIRRDGRAQGFLDFARGPRPRARLGWDPDEISRLRLVADVLGAAVQRLQLEQELARQLEVEKRVSNFARALLEHGAQGIDAGIERGLEAAATFVEADRAFLIAGTTSDTEPSVHDWSAPGLPPRPRRLGFEDKRQQRWVAEQLARGEVVRLARLEDAPAEAET
jgi:GAF domain-containing protein